jgi:hypothetical protein
VVEGHAQLAEEKRHQLEWRWLRRSLWGGAVVGAVSLGLLAFATWTPADNSGEFLAFSRGGYAFVAALFGLVIGLIAGFILWMLWVNLGSLVRLSRSVSRRLSNSR